MILFRQMLEDNIRRVERGEEPINVLEAALSGNASKCSAVLREGLESRTP